MNRPSKVWVPPDASYIPQTFLPLQQLQPSQSFLRHLACPLAGDLLQCAAHWLASARTKNLCKACDSAKCKETRYVSGFSLLGHLVDASKSSCWRRQGLHKTHFPPGNQAGGRSGKMNHIQRVPAARLLSLANATYG